MKTMSTLISYEFYYQHGEPAEFTFMAEKAKGWPLVFESAEDDDGYSSRHYTKTFGAS